VKKNDKPNAKIYKPNGLLRKANKCQYAKRKIARRPASNKSKFELFGVKKCQQATLANGVNNLPRVVAHPLRGR